MKSSIRKNDELFNQFLDASKQICDDLGISYKDVKAERYETPAVGISYSARGNGSGYGFSFDLKTETDRRDVLSGRMSASLDIYYSESSSPFYLYENLDALKPHPDFLSRWAAWAVFSFNIKHNPPNLESLFHEMQLRVYGLPQSTFPTIGEVHMVIGGIRQFPPEKLLVYRFRHVDSQVRYRSFSYAFLVSHNNFHSFWVFFPNCGGLDSGGASGDLQRIEELIGTIKTKVERKSFDISYEDLEKFLQKNAIGFRLENTTYDIHFSFAEPPEDAFGKEFVESYQKFNERYQTEDYAGALRDLRALVQEAMEITCDKKKTDLGNIQNRKIASISDKMKKSNLIDEILHSWFLAFSAGANLSSHKGFPTKKDLENYILRRKIMVTFLLGTHLIEELEKILIPPTPLKFIKGTKFKIKISPKPVRVDQTYHETLDGIG